MAGSRADIQAGRAHVSLYVKNTAFLRGLRDARQSLQKTGASMMALGRQAAMAGAAMLVPMGFAVKTFADFDDGMRSVRAVTQATDEEFKRLTDTAAELGRTTSFTAIEVANLMAELGRAGFRPDQVNAMTAAVLDLSRATGTDATLASGIMAATIRQFGLAAEDSTRVADGLTTAANKSFNTVEQLGEALSYAGPVAADFNMSLEDTLAVLGGLGNVGIQASNAGTALRRLLTITGAEAAKMEDIFGVAFIDAAGNARPLVEVLGDVNEATKDLGTAARAQKFNEAFGLLGITGASAIGRQAGDIRELAVAIKEAGGSAARAAVEMDAGLGGAFRKIMSAAEGVQLAIGEALSESLQGMTERFTESLGTVTEWIKANRELVTAIAATGAALVTTGAALVGLGLSLKIAAAGVAVLSTTVVAAKIAIGVVRGAIAAFRAATMAVATFLQGAYATSAGAAAFATASVSAAQSTAAATAVPYSFAMIGAAKATGLLAFTSGAASTGLIALTGAMGSSAMAGTALIGATGGAATGLTLAGAAATGSAVAAGGAAASFGLLSTVMGAVASAGAAMWAAIMGPATPFIIAGAAIVGTVTAIAAAAALATLRAHDFSGAWKGVGKAMAGVVSTAKEIGGALMSAFSAGDYERAAQVLWVSVRIVFWEGADAILKAFVYMFDQAWQITKAFFAQMLSTTASVMLKVANAIRNPVSGGFDAASSIAELIPSSFTFSFSTNADAARAELAALRAMMDSEASDRVSTEGYEKEAGAILEKIAAIEMGEEAAERARLKEQGLTDDQIASVMELRTEHQKLASEQAATEKAADAFERVTKSIEEQIIALREGEAAAERFRLKQEGLSDEQIKGVMKLREEQTRLEDEKTAKEDARRREEAMKEEAERLAESVRTPQEILNDRLSKISELQDKGFLSDKDAGRAEDQARKEVKEMIERQNRQEIKEANRGGPRSSVATFSAAGAIAMGSGSPQDRLLERQTKLAEKQAEKTDRTNEKLDKLIVSIKGLGLYHA